jgi:hypothetical protein
MEKERAQSYSRSKIPPGVRRFRIESSFWEKVSAEVELFPGGFPFRSFQGVNGFDDFRGFLSNDVCSQITVSGRPFCCRVRASNAVLPCGEYNRPLAALAAIYNRIAFPPVEGASLLAHEGALPAHFNYITNHLPTSLKK